MNKKIISVIAVIAIVATASWNYEQKKDAPKMSNLALANVEALADSETPEEFTRTTGCIAIIDPMNCIGKDGNVHSYAKRE